MSKFVYMFGGGTSDGDGTMRDALGGKGAGLAEMSRAGVPVPPGFTIITDVCNVFFDHDKQVPAEVDEEIWQAVEKLEALAGKKLGDAAIANEMALRVGHAATDQLVSAIIGHIQKERSSASGYARPKAVTPGASRRPTLAGVTIDRSL